MHSGREEVDSAIHPQACPGHGFGVIGASAGEPPGDHFVFGDLKIKYGCEFVVLLVEDLV